MDVIKLAEQFVFEIFKDKLSPEYTYHNFLHTEYVVSKVKELSVGEGISSEDTRNLLLAAWFHDLGYTNCCEGHEMEGSNLALDFLSKNGISNIDCTKIKSLILATQISHIPQNKLEMIMKDADTAHLGSELFDKTSSVLRSEWELQGDFYTDDEWNKKNLQFLTSGHRYYTDYAKENWLPIKLQNAVKIQTELAREQRDGMSKKDIKKKKLEKLEKPERGIETLFRVTLNNHTRLSEIADSKANILLSVNAIIISIALSTLLPKLASDKNQYLIFPTFTMLAVSVISIIFAILATKPNITKGVFSDDDLKNRKVNLLFFGNFHKMSLEKFENGMGEILNDRDYLYNSLTRDLYFLGIVLNRKYELLRITYYIFMFGTIATVIAFIFAFWYHNDLGVLF